MDEPSVYRSFLVRVRPRRARDATDPCLTVQSVATGRRQSLADWQSLVAYLIAEVAASTDTPGAPASTDTAQAADAPEARGAPAPPDAAEAFPAAGAAALAAGSGTLDPQPHSHDTSRSTSREVAP